jgi:hypothetical protein
MNARKSLEPDMEDKGDRWGVVIRLIERLGFPTVAFFCLAYGVVVSAQWAANEVIKPVTQSHVTTITAVTDSLKIQTEVLSQFAASLNDVNRGQGDLLKSGDDRKALLMQLLEEQRRTTMLLQEIKVKSGS